VAVSAAAVVAAGAGLAILADDTNSPWVVVGVLAFAVLATLPAVGRWVLHVACAGVVAMLVLLSVAALVRILLDLVGVPGRIPILLGLLLALVVFGAVAYWYLRGDWPRLPFRRGKAKRFEIPSPKWRPVTAAPCAAALAFAVILGLPLLFALTAKDSKPTAERRPVVSKIDALIVSAEPSAPASVAGELPEPYADSAGFKVTYSVGFAEGDGVRWTLTGSGDRQQAIAELSDPGAASLPPPAPVHDADRILLLVVDGTPPVLGEAAELPRVPGAPGEVERWRRIAKAAAPSGTPSFALLQTGNGPRLRDWQRFIRRGTYVRTGRALSVQRFAPPSMPDAAVQLAVGSDTAQEDYVLALRHQPILLFHSTEPVPRPLSIGALFKGGRVKQCFSRRLGSEECPVVRSPEALENGGTHLDLSLPGSRTLKKLANKERRALESGSPGEPVAPGAVAPATPEMLGEGSAMYAHPVPAESEESSILYLDYWWYLPDNPAGSGSGAFCGPGLVIPGISCFDHQSDWEGVTVVLDRTVPGKTPKVTAVHYAQHAKVASYSWDALTAAWREDSKLRRLRASMPGGKARPLVFAARGTHASYPLPCPRLRACRQVATTLGEKPHNGGLGWAGNQVACGTHPCLNLLPTALGGRAPALWNAFEGAWGERHCFLTYYCDSGSPPAAPGRQNRYMHPAKVDGDFAPDAD